jgi:geranylgeranyl diphosphate synthase, type II
LVALSARSVLDVAVSDAERPRLVDFQIELLKSLNCAGLIAGQALDLEFAREPELSGRGRVSELKTVPLFKLAVSVGTPFAKVDDDEQALLNCFAHEFGLAFQMSDDVLDEEAG